MRVRYVDTALEAHATDLLACAVIQGVKSPKGPLKALDAWLGGAVTQALASGDMRGRKADQVLLYGAKGGPRRVLLLGVGKAEGLSTEVVRRMAGRAVRAAEKLGIGSLTVSLDGLGDLGDEAKAQAAAEGAALAAWRFRELKAPDAEDPVTDVVEIDLVGSGESKAAASGTLAGVARRQSRRPFTPSRRAGKELAGQDVTWRTGAMDS
jgi:leucyl aminopeptidase